MRKSIFDIVAENMDLENEAERIVAMAEDEKVLDDRFNTRYTLFQFVNKYCFHDWAFRNHCVDVDDFLNTLDFDELKESASYDVDSMLTLIELIYNFWILSEQKVNDDSGDFDCFGNYYHLKNVMDDILAQYNHMAYIDKKNNCVLVIENKPEVTAATEIVPDELSLDVIRYNHKSLQGDIEAKRAILLRFGAELESKRKMLNQINRQLEDNIFFMLNNLHIRHNNKSKKNPSKYKEYVAEMESARLEKWYDELYQMILLAFLLLDDVSREASVDELKRKINGG